MTKLLSEELVNHFASMNMELLPQVDLVQKVIEMEKQIEAMKSCKNCNNYDGNRPIKKVCFDCTANLRNWQLKDKDE